MKPITVLLIFIALLCAMLAIQSVRLSKSHEKVINQETVIAEKNAAIEYRTNENGRIVAEKEAAVIRAKELEDAYPKIYESLKKDMDISAKNLKAFIQNEFEVHGTGQGNITTNNYYDTTTNKLVRFREFKMDDGYLKFSTTIFDSLNSSNYSYSYSDTISTAVSQKKKWIFGKSRLYATSMLKNPNAKVVGTTNILIDDYRDKRVCIGPSVTYDPFNNRFIVGVSVIYSLIKF